jgi:epsilon-lactone hydrolase
MTSAGALALAAARFLGGADPKAPTASPVFASYENISPLFMNVGDDELLLDDTLRVAERATRAGVDVTLQVQPGGFHVYPLFVPDAPESLHAMEAIASFILAWA